MSQNRGRRYFTYRWTRIDETPRRRPFPANVIRVTIRALDDEGRPHSFERQYREWIGVCTGRIDRVLKTFRSKFPCEQFEVVKLRDDCTKILPYFDKRLERPEKTRRPKPFYKVYTTACVHEVGDFFDSKYKIAYHRPEDWLVRIHVDLCTRFGTKSFYHRWYEIDDKREGLLATFSMLTENLDPPDWTVGAFDLETIASAGGSRIPDGTHPGDRIVTISLSVWNRVVGTERYLYYVDPSDSDEKLFPDPAIRCESERVLLVRFHRRIRKCHVLTGYNIDGFDLPCLFARLAWLGRFDILSQYCSTPTGVVSIRDKVVVDLYAYFKTFSDYDLPGYKLDDVARVKLGEGESKLSFDPTGIRAWYCPPGRVTRSLLLENDRGKCFRALAPENIRDEDRFGTFGNYLDYCMRDSDLVQRLFEKESVMGFLTERANFASVDASEALRIGNSKFLLLMFKTYGTALGFFFNELHFVNDTDPVRYGVPRGEKYQGALNFCTPGRYYEDVSVMDFASMYPCALLNGGLCYGSCTVLPVETVVERGYWGGKYRLVPYRNHGDGDFDPSGPTAEWVARDCRERFSYPTVDPATDQWVIVIDGNARSFLPEIVRHFLELRKEHQRLWKLTGNVYHYNAQLCIKILINSLYGVMANADSRLGYLPVAMAIVTLSRYQLLGSYHHASRLGYGVVYVDTDSLMVHRWPTTDCDAINAFLALAHVELEYEQRVPKLLIVSKKRYVQVLRDGRVVTKGFQKRINGLIRFMSSRILEAVLTKFDRVGDLSSYDVASEGWTVWVETLSAAHVMCRDPKKYTIARKTKRLDEYKSTNCPTYRALMQHPERQNDYVEYTYSRADVSRGSSSAWIADPADVRCVDFEKLIQSQKKIFVDLLNLAFWGNSPHARHLCDAVLNGMRWKCFAMAELRHRFATGRNAMLLVKSGVHYTFRINDHRTSACGLSREEMNFLLLVGEKKEEMTDGWCEGCKRVTETVGPPRDGTAGFCAACRHWKKARVEKVYENGKKYVAKDDRGACA